LPVIGARDALSGRLGRATPSKIPNAQARGRQLTEADIAAICAGYVAGQSTYELAAT